MYVVTEFRVRQLYRCSYSCIEGTDVGNVMCWYKIRYLHTALLIR